MLRQLILSRSLAAILRAAIWIDVRLIRRKQEREREKIEAAKRRSRLRANREDI